LFAARVGDAESARVLLKAGADPNDSLPDGTSALVLAAHSGHGDVGEVLLEKGADPNASGNGYTALHAAVLKSDITLVKALLAHGANPNLRTTRGTPMRRDTTDYNLPATFVGSTPYLLAARFVESEIMRVLAAGGADVKATMPNGATAVMLASGMGTGRSENRRGIDTIDFGKVEPESQVLEGVKTAVELQGDVNALNQAGDTALHSAASLGYDTVVQFLADRGAQLSVKNKRGQTPLSQLLDAGRGRGAPPAGADLTGVDAPRDVPVSTTVTLLRKLGATQ
jgi:ankyrin repeat protein